MLRKVFAVVGGLIVANLIIFGVEAFGHMLYPLPEGVSYKNTEAFSQYVKELPVEAKLIVLFGYALAAFVSGFIATRIANDRRSYWAIFCGAFLLSAIIWNFTMLLTPIWMWVLGLAAPFFVLVGYNVALNKNRN